MIILLQIASTNKAAGTNSPASTNQLAAAAQSISELQKKLTDFATDYGMQAVGAIIILVVGLIFTRWLGNLLARRLEKLNLEPPVRTLLVRLVRVIVMAFVIVMVLEKFGFPVLTLVAGMGVAGVGVGLAMQGVLKNLFAGLTIIFTKPFRVGEYVEITGVYGQVQTIELFSTVLLHPDMSRVVIPNHCIIGEILHNYGNIRQLDLSVGVGYGSNLTEVAAVVRGILDANPLVLKNPAPYIGIATLGNSTINVSVKPWAKVPDFSQAQAEIYQAIIDQFRVRKIEIPFPQHEVRLLNNP